MCTKFCSPRKGFLFFVFKRKSFLGPLSKDYLSDLRNSERQSRVGDRKEKQRHISFLSWEPLEGQAKGVAFFLKFYVNWWNMFSFINQFLWL